MIVTIDGIGDKISSAISQGDQGKIEPLKSWGGEALLGWFFGNVTEALGSWHGDGEGKTNSPSNGMGEPIACNPRQAIRCFYDNGLDVRVMNILVLEKSPLRPFPTLSAPHNLLVAGIPQGCD